MNRTLHPARNLLTQLEVQVLTVEGALSQLDSEEFRYRALKFFVPLFLCGLGGAAIIALWRAPYVCLAAITAMAWIKHKLFPMRLDLLVFVLVAVMGAYAESMIVLSGAWSYANPQIAGIAIWLPAMWGLTGVSLPTSYAALTEPIKKRVP